ncbi:MAG: hypothetical protein M1833_001815 [Piccolia ochrophora]|nr:MAG: hypothetical protein M1833_001815 [Piccolia ochrophora]
MTRQQPQRQGMQPNVQNIVEACQTLSIGFGNINNIPAMQQGNAIMTFLCTMNEQVNQRFARLEQQLHEKDVKIQALEHNSMARLQNSKLLSATDELTELHNSTTNETIDHFPPMSGLIETLPPDELSHILQALGAGTEGPIEERIKRLRVLLGLIAEPA